MYNNIFKYLFKKTDGRKDQMSSYEIQKQFYPLLILNVS